MPARQAGEGLPVVPPDWQLMALLAVALVLGGGGVGFGLSNLVVQLFAIAILAFNLPAVVHFVRSGPRGLVLLLLATLALPLIQSIPLPPQVWHALPGRDLVRDSLALIGMGQIWFPVSVESHRTLIAALSLVPVLVVIVLAHNMDEKGNRKVLALVAWLGLASVALGAIQLATDNAFGNPYSGGEPGVLFGTFANRNSAALFLVIAFVA